VIDSLAVYFILVTYFIRFYHYGVKHFDNLYVNIKLNINKIRSDKA